MFIDFGCGYDLSQFQHKQTYWPVPKDVPYVGIDRRPIKHNASKQFIDLLVAGYTQTAKNVWIKKHEYSFRLHDIYVIDDIRNDMPSYIMAEQFRCDSVLEHTPEDEVFDTLVGMYNKIDDEGSGGIHIDLSDHKKQIPPTFDHYEDDTWGVEHREHYKGFFLNRIKKDQWIELLNEFFVYELRDPEEPSFVSARNVRKK